VPYTYLPIFEYWNAVQGKGRRPGVLWTPQRVQGKVLVGVNGAKPPKTGRF